MSARRKAARVSPAVGGRPRSSKADEAIIRETLKLLEREGYLGVSIEQVALAAGVAKATIYRRYRDKAELVAQAVASRAGFLDVPDTGDTYKDLFELMRQGRTKLESAAGFALAGVLLIEESRRPEVAATFRRYIILPRRERYAAILRRGVARAELRPDFAPDVVVDALVGALYARHLAGERITDAWIEAVLKTTWRAVARQPKKAAKQP